jgi:hypothetical protein
MTVGDKIAKDATGRITEVDLACQLIRVLDGVSIDVAQQALARAHTLLLKTQIVHAESPLLAVVDETDAVLNR